MVADNCSQINNGYVHSVCTVCKWCIGECRYSVLVCWLVIHALIRQWWSFNEQ